MNQPPNSSAAIDTTAHPPIGARRNRTWDVIVGVGMMLIGFIFQFVFCGLVGMIVTVGLVHLLGHGGDDAWAHTNQSWLSLTVISALMVLVNLFAFYDFHRRRQVNTVFGNAGRMHLVPRGWNRITNGWD